MASMNLSGLSLRGTPPARITGAVRRDSNEVEEYTKTSTSRRTVPLDDYTAEAVGEWLDLKRRRLRKMAIRSVDGLPGVAELDAIKPYSSFINEWHRFIESTGFEGTRPYALRHTFATLNLAYGENIKTISVILGHATPSYTLDLYVGYMPATSAELSNRYMGRVGMDAA
ncbi:tyrosine-type recombinase/integrase [Collinsella intestinalis]|uniref:tyrosine-type recombinase/integrase n=1 Tax=Collinsella intestinalis TaxID=147207 RepID=UPI001EF49636|nr:tyrosine-type recombinase/integrase [Collinsella intestinalis]